MSNHNTRHQLVAYAKFQSFADPYTLAEEHDTREVVVHNLIVNQDWAPRLLCWPGQGNPVRVDWTMYHGLAAGPEVTVRIYALDDPSAPVRTLELGGIASETNAANWFEWDGWSDDPEGPPPATLRPRGIYAYDILSLSTTRPARRIRMRTTAARST